MEKTELGESLFNSWGKSPMHMCKFVCISGVKNVIFTCQTDNVMFTVFTCQTARKPLEIQEKPAITAIAGFSPFGGGEGSRTPVRKPIHKSFSERRRLFTFPRTDGSRQPSALGSFMMHGAGKAYRTHGRH